MCCFSNIYFLKIFLGYFRRDTFSRDKRLFLRIFFRQFSTATINNQYNYKYYQEQSRDCNENECGSLIALAVFRGVCCVTDHWTKTQRSRRNTVVRRIYPKKYKGKVFVERILLCFLQSPEQSKVTGKQLACVQTSPISFVASK